LGEECKPIIIRDGNKAFHFAFPRTLARRISGGLARLRRGSPAGLFIRRLCGGLAGLPASGVVC